MSHLSSCAGALMALPSPLQAEALNPECCIQPTLYKLTKQFLLLYLKSFVWVFFPEALEQPCLLLRTCPQETSNETPGYIFLHLRFVLHLAQGIGGLMTLLLTHNVWCVGAEGTGVASPCCSSWFHVTPAVAQTLAEGEQGGFSHFALLWCDLPGALLTCLLSHVKPESCCGWGCQTAASGSTPWYICVWAFFLGPFLQVGNLSLRNWSTLAEIIQDQPWALHVGHTISKIPTPKTT